MDRIISRSKCIIVCILMLFAVGCNTAGYSSEEHKEAEEKITEVTNASPKEESEKVKEELEEGKEEAEGKDGLEKEDLDVNGLQETAEQAVNEDKRDRVQQIENIYENDGKYSSFLKKAWIVDGPKRESGGFEFIITGISDEAIEGYIVIRDSIDWLYWSDSEIGRETCKPFSGTITGNQAECVFQYEECQVEATFLFQENDRIEAAIRCDKLDINEGYQFRPSNLSDKQLHDDVSSTPVFFETWGEVNLVSATTDNYHSVPSFYITNNDGDILYREHCMEGFVFWDIFVEDIDQDGRLDIWTVICTDHSPEGVRMVDIFYQAENGHFYREWERTDELPKEYYGEYRITQFCPTEDYVGISETVLTQQEAEQMLEKDIVIQDRLFVTYDSERRIGTRGDRELPTKDSMITEYRYSGNNKWHPVSPDLLIREAHPDERLREAVGEEYYEKINGVFSNISVGWQQFYTLEGEEKLIMHSMLTGQNFILERK
ncbi:MAG: hypothetical protein HDR04_18845 [Lachnospiraceae bacterium]|nr:hypothetical protein [Lachnospiraceae bacterium]